MKKQRIEIHLDSEEVKVLDTVAKKKNRSRKNYCENVIRENIKAEVKQ